MAEETTITKKTPRSRKTTIPNIEGVSTAVSPVALSQSQGDPFSDLDHITSKLQSQFTSLQKEMLETRLSWEKEQKDHQQFIEERNRQEELVRKRDQEAYEYQINRDHKIAEDTFTDKKAFWEKQLLDKKEEIEKDKTELDELRKLVAGFETQKQRVIDQAQEILQKQLVEKFESEKKLREQEIKSERELLNLKLTNLTTENSKQTAEIKLLKETLDKANQQVKEIAVKVIESGSSSAKTPTET